MARAGFFSVDVLVGSRSPSLIAKCGACGLYKKCESPKMSPTGEGQKKILVVAEAPGRTEDAEGVQLVGESGQLLRRVLKSFDVFLDRDCYKTNAVICHPGRTNPTDEQVRQCRPNVTQTIKKYRPNVIVLLGAAACKSVIGAMWREDVGGVTRWVGRQIPGRDPNAWICPTYHPSYLLRSNDSVLDLLFQEHLRVAVEIADRPWKKVPDFSEQVEIILDTEKVGSILRKMMDRGGEVAFDYETNCLKPETVGSKIVSCAVCWQGKKTIAYPWSGQAKEATSELLRSKLPKIAANLKFEDRWTRNKLGHSVTNWQWDTMLAAHALDNRTGVTSVKFQAFARLGQPDYDSHIKDYLKSMSEKGLNRIGEIDWMSLLLYNGLDALLEFKIAEHQRREMVGMKTDQDRLRVG